MRVMGSGRDVDHRPPSLAEVKESEGEYSYTSTPLLGLRSLF